MRDDINDAVNKNGLTIKKVDLARSIQLNAGLSKTDSAQIINQMLSLITDSLASGKNVKLSSFGTFHLLDKAERTGRNPRTNEEVSIAPRRVVRFKASSKLTQRVMAANSNNQDPSSNQLTDKKREVLNALGNKIGSQISDLDFIFKSTSENQVQQDVLIPDVRSFNS